MSFVNLKATRSHPAVTYKGGKLLIKGRSIPSDVKAFYQPLIDWAGGLHVKKLTVDIDLEYMNSASSKKLFYLLKVFDNNKFIQEFSVIWHYDEGDEEILVSGQVFAKLLSKVDFRFKEKKEPA
jgi:hypothetical protein